MKSKDLCYDFAAMTTATGVGVAKTSLVRAMNRWDLAALAINGIIGAGIFGLPSTAAAMLGAASPIAFILCSIIVYVFVLCFAEVASQFRETGGPYLYARTIFGSFIGFEVGWSAWVARLSAFAANSNVLIAYLGFFVPQVTSGLPRAAVMIAVTAALAVINIRGIRGSAQVSDIFAAAKIFGLVLFGAIGLFFVNWTTFSTASVPSNANWGGAILLLIYAFTGFESAVIPAAEAKNPQSDMAWALILSLGISVIIYLCVQVVAFGTVPGLAASQRPLADAGRNFLGPIAGGVISLLACVSIVGNLSNIAIVCPRLTYAFSEQRDFPNLFGYLHPRFGTPVVSILFFAAIASILAISGTFVLLVTVSVIARLVNYAVTCLALPILRKRTPERSGFRIFLGPACSILGIALCIWLGMQAAARDILAFAMASAIGALFYFAGRRPGRTTRPFAPNLNR